MLKAILIVLFVGTFAPNGAFAQAGYMWYCWDNSHKTHLYYISGTFGPAGWVVTATREDIAQVWGAEFGAYIFRIYGEQGSAAFHHYDTTSALEADQQLGERQFGAQLKGKYLRTGWLPIHLQ